MGLVDKEKQDWIRQFLGAGASPRRQLDMEVAL